MSDYFERVEAHLLDAVEREAQLRGGRSRATAGAQRRQRARPDAPPRGGALGAAMRAMRGALRGPGRGLWLITAVLLLGGSAAAAVLISAERSRSLSGIVPPYNARGNLSVAGGHYEITITPSLKAGTIGWCTSIHFRDVPSLRAQGGETGGGGCPTSTPALGSPLFAPSSERGPGLWYVLSAPRVAAVRVANGPTVLTRADARLPYGFRAAVFELSARAFAHGAPRVTALDSAGQAIPGSFYEAPPREPARYWQSPQRELQGRCPLTARRGSGVRPGLGEVLTAIVPDPGIIGHGYLSCVEVGFRFHHVWLTAAVLLDAKHPGELPAALPDMHPVPGAPGVLDRSGPFRPEGFSARRVGDAWLVVQGEASVSQRVQALRALRVGAIDLRPPRHAPSAPAGAPCAIVARPLAGLREVSQSARTRSRLDQALAMPAPRGTLELAECAQAAFYYRDWPLTATVLLIAGGHGPSPQLADKRAVPGHPGVFTVRSEEEGSLETVRRVGGAWLEVKGGSGTEQQRIVLERLAARTPARGGG
ncbi:MAG TPA: hypothetical protein VGL57_09815 [Solirubrobacteraceae bacterium]|jgi:hypothetical protein